MFQSKHLNPNFNDFFPRTLRQEQINITLDMGWWVNKIDFSRLVQIIFLYFMGGESEQLNFEEIIFHRMNAMNIGANKCQFPTKASSQGYKTSFYINFY